jgi:AmiR/NasT family two-component response regulator
MSASGGQSQSHTLRRAVEIVASQLRCDEHAALETLEAVALAADAPLEDVANHVLEGTVRFDA